MSPVSIRVNAPWTTLLSAFSLCLPTHGLFDLVRKLRHVLGPNAPLLLFPSQHGFAGGEVDFIHLDGFEKLDERPAALCVLSQLSACREEDLRFLHVAVSCEDPKDFQVAWYLRERLSTIVSRSYLYETPV